MKRKRFSSEQIVKILRTVERSVGEGQTVAAAIREHGVTEQTYYRWKRKYGQMGQAEVRRFKELEKENQ